MDNAHENAGTLSDEAMRSTECLKEKGADMIHRMESRGSEMLDEQKARLCDEMQHYSAALRRAAESLHDDDDERIASAADRMADELETAVDYLKRSPVSRIYHDAEDLARRRPEWVFGGLFLAGLAVGRFLKASGRTRLMDEPGANYEYSEYEDEDSMTSESSGYAPTPPPAYAHTSTGEEPYSGVEPYVRPSGAMEE